MSTAFETLLREFAVAKGLAGDETSMGLEFESEGHSVVVIQHPLHPDHVMVEVSVVALDAQPAAAQLAVLLQLNEAARFEHDWSVGMDGAMQVSLCTTAPAASLSVMDLESLMLEGVERAQALAALLGDEALQGDAALGQSSDPALAVHAAQMLRG